VNRLTKQANNGVLQRMRQVLEAFRLNWKLFLGIHIAVNVFSLLVLTPLVTLLMGWLILISGHTALTDEDILFFVLSPAGMIIMLLAGAMYATVVVFQQAAMITAAYNVTSGNAVNISRLVRYLCGQHFQARTLFVGEVLAAIPACSAYGWTHYPGGNALPCGGCIDLLLFPDRIRYQLLPHSQATCSLVGRWIYPVVFADPGGGPATYFLRLGSGATTIIA